MIGISPLSYASSLLFSIVFNTPEYFVLEDRSSSLLLPPATLILLDDDDDDAGVKKSKSKQRDQIVMLRGVEEVLVMNTLTWRGG